MQTHQSETRREVSFTCFFLVELVEIAETAEPIRINAAGQCTKARQERIESVEGGPADEEATGQRAVTMPRKDRQ